MLQRIRDNASGPLAYAVVALISLVFGVWGIGSYFTDSPNPAVAQVGGTEITKYELQQAYDQRYQRLQQLMGDGFDHDLIKPESFRRDVLDGLIQRATLSQYGETHGYRVTDQELLNTLRDDSRFQVDGEFSSERYRALLSQARIAPGAYENNLRNDIQIQQVREGVLDTSFVTQREVGFEYRLEYQKRQLAYLSFTPGAYREGIDITDTQVEDYYRDQSQAFMTPERVKLAYVDVDRNNLNVAEKPDEEYLRAIYDQEKEARFQTPERRKARHILVRIDEETSDEAAREKIQALAKQLDEGADFAELATENSDEESSAEEGGQLDWITPGTMVQEFEQALFELEPGSISRPVRTDFGWHLIKLEEVEQAQVKPFDDDEVQTELVETYRSQEREERYRQMVERLDSLSFEAPDSLQPLADELEIDVRNTGWITRDSGEDSASLGKYDAVRKAAFSDSVLKDGLNSTPIQLSGDRQVVVRVVEHEQAERKPLAEVKGDIRSRLEDAQAKRRANEAAQAALEALQSGKSMDEVAQDTQAEQQNPGWVTRSNSELPAALTDKLFTMAHPQQEKATYSLADLDTSVAVLQLSALEQAKPGSKDVVDSEKVARALRGRVAGLEFAAFRKNLMQEIDVEIEEDRIN